MKTYKIYNIDTDEYLGEVRAFSVIEAELTAIKELKLMIDSYFVAAFSKKDDED